MHIWKHSDFWRYQKWLAKYGSGGGKKLSWHKLSGSKIEMVYVIRRIWHHYWWWMFNTKFRKNTVSPLLFYLFVCSMLTSVRKHLTEKLKNANISTECTLYDYDAIVPSHMLWVPRLASAVTWSRGPRPWRGFTHGPLTTAKYPLRFRMRPDHEHGNVMGRVDMERGPDSV